MKKLIHNVKGGVNIVTAALIIVIIIVAAIALGYISIDDGTTGAVYAGRLKVNNIEVKRLDGAAYNVASSFYRVIHGSKDWNDKVGTYSADSVTGDMKADDEGTWYLCIDYGTNTTQWLDLGETLKDPYVKSIFGYDGDRDGFQETYIELYFGGLGSLMAGEDKKEVEITTVWDVSDLNPTYTSLTNASSIGTTSYAYYTSTGYTAGTAEGEMMKLAKIQLDFSETGNDTYPDSNYWMLTHLKIGPYTFTSSDFGQYDLANKRYEITFGDQINAFGGKDLYYAKNGGTLWANYELKAYCKFPSASKDIICTVKFYLYQPNGVLTSAIEAGTQFSS